MGGLLVVCGGVGGFLTLKCVMIDWSAEFGCECVIHPCVFYTVLFRVVHILDLRLLFLHSFCMDIGCD